MDKILIVDSLRNTELLWKLLSNEKCEIFVAHSGRNAVEKVKEFFPDLIIMDTDLPDASGYDVCKSLKDSEEFGDIIILLMSSQNNKSVKVKALSVGADDFIEKNFDSFILLSKVKSLLRIKYLRMQLQKKYAELQEKNDMLAKQLEMAQNLQRILIPEFDVKDEKIDVYSRYLPAMYIGGDFYDVINLEDDCICIMLGDVSGHGISAALLTSMLDNMIKNIVREFPSPDQVLEKLNQEFILAVNTNEIYACVFIAIIDTSTKKIFYSNAGQPLPIYISNGKAEELVSTGVPIGMMNDSQYECQIKDYESGARIFIHTDGLENNAYKDRTDEFEQDLKAVLEDTAQSITEISNVVLDKFYYVKSDDKIDPDDVSIIFCQLH